MARIRPIRVLAYADSADSYGAEAVFRDVVEALAHAPECELTLAVSARNRVLWEAMKGYRGAGLVDVPVHPPRIAPIGVWSIRRGRRIRGLIGATDAEVMLVNLPGVEYGSAPLVWARKEGIALIAILHLHQSIDRVGGWRRLGVLRDRLARGALSRADHVLLISPRGPAEFTSDFGVPAARVSVLPLRPRPAVRMERERARSILGLSNEDTIVGMIGRVEIRQKGHDVFVAAARMMVGVRDDLRFLIAGDGPDEQAVHSLAERAGIADRLVFVGAIRPADVLLSALDAIAFPSRFEGLPLTAIEALTVGLPGVATDVDGLGSIWPGQWRVAADDPVDLSRRLLSVLDAPEAEIRAVIRTALGHAGSFLEPDLTTVLVPLIERLAGERGGRSARVRVTG